MDIESAVRHLGGWKALSLMIGAHSFVVGGNDLTFQFKGSRKMNRVRISLNGSDLYDLEFYSGRGVNTRKTHEVNDVFWDNLQEVFEDETGLILSVPFVKELK